MENVNVGDVFQLTVEIHGYKFKKTHARLDINNYLYSSRVRYELKRLTH